MDPTDPEDWYREPLRPNGMIEMYQHQALWDNRQDPRIHAIWTAEMTKAGLEPKMAAFMDKPSRPTDQ